MSWAVPLTDVSMPEEDVEAVLDCLRAGRLSTGRTRSFEAALAAYVGSPHVVCVSSGTAALHLACLTAGLGPGDEAIVPGLTFVATASAVRYTGAEPVLCEVGGPADLNIDPEDAAARITPRTKAIIAVHLCGYPAPVAALRELCDAEGLTLIEDCAQAIGAQVAGSGRRMGTVGELGCFSLFSKKQLCVGEGGFVSTAIEAWADRVRSLRSHAKTRVLPDGSYDIVDIGFDYRLDEPHAALGLSRLSRLEAEIGARRRAAQAYRERLAGLPGLELPWDDSAVEQSSHFGFPVVLSDRAARDAFRSALGERGVQTTWYPALHRFSDYRRRGAQGSLPAVEAAAERHCVLPMSATLSEADLEIVVQAARAALS